MTAPRILQVLCLPALIAAACTLSVYGGETPQVTLPEAATAAVTKLFPGAKIDKVEREHEHGVAYYEVDVTTAEGRLELEVTDDGVVGEVEGKVAPEAVPAAVLAEFKRAVGDIAPDRVERHDRHGEVRDGAFKPLATPTRMYEFKYTKDGKRQGARIDVVGDKATYNAKGDDNGEHGDQDDDGDGDDD